MSKKINAAYDKSADEYVKFAPNSFSWLYVEKPILETYLKNNLNSSSRVLEIGSGGGRVIEYLVSRGVKEKNIIGIELSNKMISIAKKNFPRVHFIHSDIASHKLNFEKLDVVVSNMVLFYLDDRELQTAVQHIYKWLKHGGILATIVTHPIRLMVYNNLKDYFNRGWVNINTPWGTNVPYFQRTTADYMNIIIRGGFKILSIDEPSVIKKGKESAEKYKEYMKFPSRLAIKAKK